MKNHIPELDSLRGLAAFFVFFHHLFPQANWISWGWGGVNLFFVLSGFLITAIILENYRNKGFFQSFYMRRILRIWPVYYLSIAFVLVISSLFEKQAFPYASLPNLLTFTLNIRGWWNEALTEIHYRLNPLWSISVEEQFYLVWPALIYLLGRRGILPFLSFVIVGVTIARANSFKWNTIVTSGDALAMGALVTLILQSQFQKNKILLVSFLLLFGGFFVAVTTDHVETREFYPFANNLFNHAFNFMSAAVIAIAVTFSGHPALGFLRTKLGVWFGKISYGIYLYHMIVFWLVDGGMARIPILGGNPIIATLLKVMGTLVVAALSWRWIEEPILRFKDRWSYKTRVS